MNECINYCYFADECGNVSDGCWNCVYNQLNSKLVYEQEFLGDIHDEKDNQKEGVCFDNNYKDVTV